MSDTNAKKTPFYDFHVSNGAKLVDYAGYSLPLHYGSLLEEHKAVREGAGIFDVSHMGRVKFSGRHARRFLERICSRRISDMQTGQCRYSMVCNETGGVMDDVIIYRFEDHWLMVCNAANRKKLLQHFDVHKVDLSMKIEDLTDSTGMIAIQGPKVIGLIGKFSTEIPTLKRYRFVTKNLVILKLHVSRTGYTGEDGVEIIMPKGGVSMALKLFIGKAGDDAVRPCGLGCRDSLRTEAGMPLYGHELTEELDPISAGLHFAVNLDKGSTGETDTDPTFIGQESLQKIADEGPARKLIGLKMEGRRSPRQDMKVLSNGNEIGFITSGCLSPTLGYPIAMGYVDAAQAESGGEVEIDFGAKSSPAQIVPLPFYKIGS